MAQEEKFWTACGGGGDALNTNMSSKSEEMDATPWGYS